ncbi:MAG: putative LPS assembly protein LptD, partial [Bacteroidia bacterium]
MLTIACNINFYAKTVPLSVWLLLFVMGTGLKAGAQIKLPNNKTKVQKAAKDTVIKTNNSAKSASPQDTIARKDTTVKFADTLNIPVSKSALTAQVKYKAKDSIIYDIETKKVYLYGTAHIEYQDIVLDADFITIDWNTNEISASGRVDSTGKIAGKPKFKEGEQEFKTDSIKYNFKTKRGRISSLRTQEGQEGYIHTNVAKTVKNEEGQDVIFAKDAKYTTCELDDPHFYIQTNKLKLIPKDKIITGPALIFVEKIPVPLVLPFGFFPANSRKTSGIIIPSVGNSGTRGFVLRDGGFYYGGSEYFDPALIGDIYTGGSYRASVQSKYAKRYRFDGDLSLSYARLDNGQPKETPGFDVTEEYYVTWSHFQNPKAHPGTTFNANVNAGSSKYLKQTSFNANAIRTQNLQSSISYGKQFRGTPFNLTAALNHSQVLSTGQIDFTLPNINHSMNRINPFKGKNAIQKRWYHDIGVSYNLNVQNRLQTSDSTIRKDFTLDKFNNGAHLTVPITTAFKVFNYFSLSPSFNVDEFFYTKRSFKTLNHELNKIDTFTENGFFMAHTWRADAGLSTLIYGMFPINKGRLIALRHQVTPSVTMSYRPDYGDEKFGYYRKVQLDTTSKRIVPYSIYEESASVAGYPSIGKQGSAFFSINNNVELKVRTKKDTAQATKKIKIFEQLNVTGGYNFLADSLNLMPFTLFASTTLFEKINIQGGASLDPYQIVTDTFGYERRINKFVSEDSKALGRFTSANLSFSTDFNAEAR